MYNKRWNKIKSFLADKKAHAFVVTKPGNLRYLSSATVPYSPLLSHLVIARRGDIVGITPSLEEFRAKRETPIKDIKVFCSYEKVPNDGKTGLIVLKKVLGNIKATKVMSDNTIAGVKTKVDNFVERMRMKKDASEIKAMRAACRITDIGARELARKIIAPGKTEQEVANELDFELRRHRGVQGVSFETIIASGRRHSTYSHHNNTPRKLEDGDLVICDFGISYKGYCSDVTRTHAVGSVQEKLIELFDIVHEAQKAAIKASRAGVDYCKIDLAARKVIDDYGYGRYFVHSVGHGLGLEVHEDPMGIRPETKGKVERGHVFTIEPGIYLPRKGGIRIEDDVHVTGSGVEPLSKASKWL